MSKEQKIWLGVGVVGGVLFIVFLPNDLKRYFCGYHEIRCYDFFNLTRIYLFLGPAILLATLASLRATKEAFIFWQKATLLFILIFLLWIGFMPDMVGDVFFGFTKGLFALIVAGLYTAWSAFYFLGRKKSQ
jgi:hypothetical protein